LRIVRFGTPMSSSILFVLYSLAGLIVTFFLVRLGFSLYSFRKLRGKRLVTCPETHKHAAVEVDAVKAARESFFTSPFLRLSACSRWPEREGCGQECLREIELAPEECLVKTYVTRWYAGKKCVYCGRPIREIDWLGHKPGLLAPDQRTVSWASIPPEKLSEVFATHTPVCWDCHVTESFRHDHPERIVDRPWH
jgi:hypothetical protein